MDIIAVIKDKYKDMTKKQKQIADYMITNPDKMTFITLKELGQELCVSEITILNACSMLQYANFNEVKYEFRKYLSAQQQLELHEDNNYMSSVEIPSHELNDKAKFLKEICIEEVEAMHNMMNNIDYNKIIQAANSIIAADKVIICGRGVSRLIAEALSIRLATSGVGSIFINTELNDSIHSALPMISNNSIVIPISFPDYYMMTTKMAEYAHKVNASVLGITNSSKADIVQYCDQVLLCPSTTRLFLNTISAALAVVNVLSSAVEIKMLNNKSGNTAEVEFCQLFQE